jgi:hypothetical protein
MLDKAECERLRRAIKPIAEELMVLYRETRAAPMGSNAGETLANAMLAYRHLEDASMRLGKAIQALDGGTSVYDQTQVPAASNG